MDKIEQLEVAFKEAIDAVTEHFMGRIKELREQTPSKLWKPESDERYWIIDAHGECRYSRCDNDSYDQGRLAMGNVYPTKEAAEKARDKQLATVRVLNALREAEGDWESDWGDSGQDKWQPKYRHDRKEVELISWQVTQHCHTEWYSLKESWEKVLLTHEADVKLILGVE